MKLLVVGDQHFHAWTAFSSLDPKTGINSRLLDQLNLLEELARIRDQHDCAATIWLGDWWHQRTKLDAQVVSLVTQKTYELWAGHTCYWLVGNHDTHLESSLAHNLAMLSPLGEIIAEPTTRCLGCRVHFFPFQRNVDVLKAQFNCFGSADLIFCHQGLDEAVVGAYNVSIKASLSVMDLPPSELVLAGHYHKPQTLVADRKALYVGSIMQNDMGDREDGPRRVIVLDTQTMEFTSVPLTGAPEFYLYPSLDAAHSGKHRECDFVRIQCRKAEVADAQASFPKAQIEVTKELVTERRVIAPEATQSDRALLESYLSEKKPELNRERLLQVGLSLLQED